MRAAGLIFPRRVRFDALQPESPTEPATLGALATGDGNDVLERSTLCSGNRGQHFKNVGGLFENVVWIGRTKFIHFFPQFVA